MSQKCLGTQLCNITMALCRQNGSPNTTSDAVFRSFFSRIMNKRSYTAITTGIRGRAQCDITIRHWHVTTGSSRFYTEFRLVVNYYWIFSMCYYKGHLSFIHPMLFLLPSLIITHSLNVLIIAAIIQPNAQQLQINIRM